MRRAVPRAARLALATTLWLLAVPLAGTAGAAGAAPGALWSVTPVDPGVGDAIAARLTLTLPSGARADWDAVRPDFAGLTLEGVVPAPGGAGRAYTLSADLPGTYRLPEVAVPWRGADGTTGTARAAAVQVAVRGAFDPAGPVPDPAGYKPPVGLPLPPWVPAAVGGVALALGVASWLLWRRLTRPAPPAEVPPAASPRPHEAALARLARLDPEGLAPRAFYEDLSDVARAYLEGRFGVPARRRTTAEMGRLLAGRDGAPLSAGAPVAEWLKAWDLVKFAGLEPPPEEARAHLEAVRRWVVATAAREA